MKQLRTVALVFLGLVFMAASCQKPKEEWQRYYGYTKADVIGHYESNPDSSLYEELPTVGVEVYPNVEINITEYNEDLVSVRIVIPNIWYRTFRGVVALNENDSDIAIGNDDGSDILMTVYRRGDNEIRLHGRARERHIWTDPVVSFDYIIYGFDVIKTPSESVAK